MRFITGKDNASGNASAIFHRDRIDRRVIMMTKNMSQIDTKKNNEAMHDSMTKFYR